LAQDGRGVQTAPVIPQGCTRVQATKTIASSTAFNVDPLNPTISTPKKLGGTGGTSLEPNSETLDTALPNAIASAAAGSCVEAVPGSGGQLGMVLAPWKPVNSSGKGVVVVVDAPITIFASRNPGDYSGTNCGVLPTSYTGSTSCGAWITVPGVPGAAIMGYGTLDARGWDKFTSGGQGFNSNKVQTLCDTHSGGPWAGITCPISRANNGIANGPNIMNWLGSCSACNNIVQGVTLKDSGQFFILTGEGLNGFTTWDINELGAAEVSNTDGIDHVYCAVNGTDAYDNVSVGDNHWAFKANSTRASGQNCTTKGFTLSHNNTGAGIGITFGYESTAISGPGISSVLIDTTAQKGSNNNPTQQVGHGIHSHSGEGGSVSSVTFNHSCVSNEGEDALLYDMSDSGSFSGISDLNDTILGSQNVSFQGASGRVGSITLNNVTAASVSGTYKYTTFAGQNVSFTPSGTGVTNGITNPGGNTPYPCTSSTWQALWGNLTMQIGTQSNYQSYTSPGPTQAVTLQATLRPSTAVNILESKALTQNVCFFDGATSLGCAAIGGNGAYAALTVTAPAGTHNYSARYSGDPNYPGLVYNFGSPTMTVGGSTTVTATPVTVSVVPTLLSTYLTAPGSPTTLTVGSTLQFSTFCHYSSGPDQNCTGTDIYGDVATSFTSSNTAFATIEGISHPNPGLASAVAAGSVNITSAVNHTVVTPNYPLTINSVAVTLTGVSLATTGGVTGLFVGSTNQLIATCVYSDSSTTNCTTTDSHGNVANTYVSTTPGHATVNGTTGLVTGVAAGATTFTAHAGSFTSTAIPLTVLAVPTGIYTITISGPVNFSGSVNF
jgi:hypothetical protein